MYLSLHRRLTLFCLLPAALIIIILGLFLGKQLIDERSHSHQQYSLEISVSLAQLVRHGWPFAQDTGQQVQALRYALEHSEARAIALYDQKQQLMIDVGAPILWQPVFPNISTDELSWQQQDQRLYVLHALNPDQEGTPAWLVLYFDTRGIALANTRTVLLVFSLVLGCLVLLYLAIGLASHQIVRPIEQMLQASQHINENNLEFVLNTQTRTPELLGLERLINQLLIGLRKANQELNDGITEATEDLRRQAERYESRNINLEALVKTAKESERVKSQFLANMSHEMRTPLNAISGFIGLLGSQIHDHKHQEYLNRVSSATGTLLSLLNDLLDYSKISAGKLSLELKTMDLREQVEEVIGQLTPLAHSKKLRLSYEMEASLPTQVEADRMRLRQILTNLINNAIKFTEQGSIHIKVSGHPPSSLDTDQPWQINFQIIDSGMGIAPEHMQSLFAPFVQVDDSNSRQQSGTGLGLSICKRLVELMGGDIQVTSVPKQGSTFWFDIKVQAVDSGTATKTTAKIIYLHIHEPMLLHTTQSLCQYLGLASQICDHAQLERIKDNSLVLYAPSAQEFSNQSLDLARYGQWAERLQFILLLPYPEMALSLSLHEWQIDCLYQPLLARNLTPYLGQPAARDQGFNSSMQLLLVDDNQSNLRVLEAFIEPLKLTLDFAESGHEALAKLTQKAYDLVLLDIQMPGMDGIETLQAMRKHPHGAQVPIVAVTAQTFEQERLLALGFDDYLPKPVEWSLLNQTLLQWLIKQPKDKQGQDGAPAPLLLAAKTAPSELDPDCVFDPEHAQYRANHTPGLAQELMDRLLVALAQIQQQWPELTRDHELLAQRLHWLKGASKQCGVNALNCQIELVEQAIKLAPEDLEMQLEILAQDIEDVLALRGGDWPEQLQAALAVS